MDDPEAIGKAREAILAALPLPVEVPEDALQPIELNSPLTLHDLLTGASGVRSSSMTSSNLD